MARVTGVWKSRFSATTSLKRVPSSNSQITPTMRPSPRNTPTLICCTCSTVGLPSLAHRSDCKSVLTSTLLCMGGVSKPRPSTNRLCLRLTRPKRLLLIDEEYDDGFVLPAAGDPPLPLFVLARQSLCCFFQEGWFLSLLVWSTLSRWRCSSFDRFCWRFKYSVFHLVQKQLARHCILAMLDQVHFILHKCTKRQYKYS